MALLLRSSVVPPFRKCWQFCSSTDAAVNVMKEGRVLLLGGIRGHSFAAGYSALTPKPLNSLIDIHRFGLYSREDLPKYWANSQNGRGHIATVMKSELYGLLQQRASSCVHFVVPVKAGRGYVTMFSQAKMPHHLLFTGLQDYRAKGTQASPYLTVTYYTDFGKEKGLVLVLGEVVLPSKMSDEQAIQLLEDAHSFYLHDSRYKLVEQFNRDPAEFEFKGVLQALSIA